MTDKQEIIETLWKIIGFFSGCRDNAHEGSQFKALFQGYMDAAKGAAELLKEKEPRVLTLDEVKKLPTETDVWIQHAGKLADDVIRAATVSEVTNASISFWFGGSLYYKNYGEKPYGWICWTSRPTDEQRKAVKWDD